MDTAILGLAIVNASRFFGKLIADIFAILFTCRCILVMNSRTMAGDGVLFATARDFPILTRGAISAFSTFVSPQIGHAISPAFAWASYAELLLNHASKTCSLLHLILNEIMDYRFNRKPVVIL